MSKSSFSSMTPNVLKQLREVQNVVRLTNRAAEKGMAERMFKVGGPL